MNPDTQFRGGSWIGEWAAPTMPSAVRIEMAPAVPDPNRLPIVAITAPLYVNRFFDEVHYDDY
jgi:hypothetical protein